MATITKSLSGELAEDVLHGLSGSGQKRLSSRFFYDDLGSALFEAITLLPEYGLTRADERLLRTHAPKIAHAVGHVSTVAEIGSGSGRKTRFLLEAFTRSSHELIYRPVDVSAAALAACELQLGDVAEVRPILADWFEGLDNLSRVRSDGPALVLFLGSTIGNLDRPAMLDFLSRLRVTLRPGDYFLLGADLVKDIDIMLRAYDDPTGVTAAFNLNVLARINRELDADFDLRSFAHEARWNPAERRIEMHLRSERDRRVRVRCLDRSFCFRAGETIWTESSHKFSLAELKDYALRTGFNPLASWVDAEWPFANVLWRVTEAGLSR